MGKNVVVHLSKCVPGLVIASSRIGLFLRDFLQIPLLHTKEDFIDYKDQYIDNMFLINGASAFSNILEEIADLVMRTKRVIFVQNDYTLYPPTQVRKSFLAREDIIVDRWSTIPKLPKAWETWKTWVKTPVSSGTYINWNMLTYNPQQFKSLRKYPDHLFYYGAYRNDREYLFEKYFESVPYPIAISSSKKKMEKFLNLNPCIDDFPTFKNLIEEIQQFATTLYIEDRTSSQVYCSPANRFYECLSAGVAMLFDKTCINTMQFAGYDVSEFVVDSPEDVNNKLKHWKDIAIHQYEIWREDYIGDLKEQIKNAISKL